MVARYTGPGGHSWSTAIARAPRTPWSGPRPQRSRWPAGHANVGVLEGGIAINAIAAEARLELDLRSEDDAVVEAAMHRAQAALNAVPAGIEADVRIVGRRPGGRLADDHPLLVAARAARERAGLPLATEETASTDANAALGLGIPGLALGISRGGGTHREDEWIELAPAAQGVDAARRLVRALAGLGG